MQLKPKKLLLNTRQPTGMWVIFITTLFFTMSSTTLTITLDSYTLEVAPYLDYLKQNFDFSLYSNLYLFAFAGIIGGIIGYIIGHKRSVVIGIFYSVVGLLLLSINNLALIGFSAYVIGIGITLPNLLTTLSFLYTQDDPRRHAGFTLVYMASVFGSALAILLNDFLAVKIGYQALYALMTIFSVIAALVFMYAGTSLNRNIGITEGKDARFTPSNYTVIFILILLSTLLSYLLDYIYVLEIMIVGIAAVVFVIMVIYTLLETDFQQRKRAFALLILSVFGICYWLVDKNILIIFLNYLNFFSKSTEMTLPGFISANFIFEINIVLIVIFGLTMAVFWNKNKLQKHIVQITRFFALALTISAISCLLIALSITLEKYNIGEKIAAYLLLITVALNSIAKIILLPLYYAIVGKLSPRKYESVVMGFFFILTSAVGVISIFINDRTLRHNFEFSLQYQYLSKVYFILATAVFAVAASAFVFVKIWEKYLKAR